MSLTRHTEERSTHPAAPARGLAAWRDLHAGETIVVCGCGTSLNGFAERERFVTIGVNDVGRLFDPTYLVVVNPRNQFKVDRFRFVEESNARALFTQLELGRVRPPVVRFRLGKYGGTDMGATEVLHYTQNSPYVAVCLAAWMGARHIGLIGVDLTDHHFFGPTGRHSLAGRLREIDEQYGRLAAALAEQGVELVNLSPVSRLASLPRRTADELVQVSLSNGGAMQSHRMTLIPGAPTPARPAANGGSGTLVIRTMEGMGDNLWSRPHVLALARTHRRLQLVTPWPQCYADFAEDYAIEFARPTTRLRTQNENVRHWRDWKPVERQPEFRLAYSPDEIRAGRNHHDSLEASARRWLNGTGVSPLDIAIRLPPTWEERAEELIHAWSKINGPVVLIRPPTVRREWENPARNCDPAALQQLIDQLRPDHTLVGIASLADGAEWLASPPRGLHVERYRGEIPVETLLGLAGRAWMLGANGFMVPMALAARGYAYVLFGGNFGYNSPENLFHPAYDLSRIGWSVPDRPCRGCVNPRHECSKRIDPARLAAEFGQWRSRQTQCDSRMGSMLSSHGFNATYYEEHLAAGLDYVGYGEWQTTYATWLAEVFEWKGWRVLDVGCACGAIMKGFVDAAGVDARGVDVSEHMIQKGREAWPALAHRLHCCDAVNLHLFADGAFDGLHSAQVAEHWKPSLVPHILAECHRVLRPGGLFFCCMDTAELYAREGRSIATEDPTHYCIQPLAWWRSAFTTAGFHDRTDEFRSRLLAHPRSMLSGSTSGSRAKYAWDFLVVERSTSRSGAEERPAA
jgi:SAM-dependent methyltransferase